MKTPMQELIEQLKEERDLHGYDRGFIYETAIELAEAMLEKEKEVMCEFAKLYDDDLSNGIIRTREDLFNETFKTKEI